MQTEPRLPCTTTQTSQSQVRRTGLSKLQRSGIAIQPVISDLVMPGISGTVLGQELALLNPDVRLLLMSGYEKQNDALDVLPDGVGVGFLEKPFDLSRFATAVRDDLDRTASLAYY